MSGALAPSSCNEVCGRCAHKLSERAHASSPYLDINHKHTNMQWWNRVRGGGVVQSGLYTSYCIHRNKVVMNIFYFWGWMSEIRPETRMNIGGDFFGTQA
jgi:hypothetical protein